MNFKDIFDKEILNENYVRKELKIIYELKLDLYKPEMQENTEQPQQNQQSEVVNNTVPSAEVPQQDQIAQAVPEQPIDTTQQQPEQTSNNVQNNTGVTDNEIANSNSNVINKMLSSVVTEDEASINDNNRIMRNFEGEISLSDSQKDNIQSFEDIVEVLSDHKKDGTNVIDGFCAEVITLCANQQYDQIKQKVDKKSKIWVELYYGYNKDDSIGLRFSKRQNSDTLTSTMLVDNEIVSAKFSIDKVNQKIAEYRNYDAKKS